MLRAAAIAVLAILMFALEPSRGVRDAALVAIAVLGASLAARPGKAV